ncbi:hypothetical protein [Streptomyces sp. NPDC091416]|uniref:hypothetical protein n=1 Tax=Streptomyces sp. NPDC091416 TaxID=3366003 RepID=UPI003812AE57
MAEKPIDQVEPDGVGSVPEHAQEPTVVAALTVLRAAHVTLATVPGRKMLYRNWHGAQGPQGAFVWPGTGRTLEVVWFMDGAQDERGMRTRDTRTVRRARNDALDAVASAFQAAGWRVWRVESRRTATRRALHIDVTPPADGEPQSVISEQQAEALATEFGIKPGDLDEAVYDAANESGAREYNNGAHPEASDEDAHERVHDAADARASSVNNQGVTAQLRFLADFCDTADSLRSLLRDHSPAAAEAPSTAS